MQTVAWRGYQFTGEVRLAAAPTSAVLAPSQMTNPFPAPVSELIRAWRGDRFGLTYTPYRSSTAHAAFHNPPVSPPPTRRGPSNGKSTTTTVARSLPAVTTS